MGSCRECKNAEPKNPRDSSPRSGQVWCTKANSYMSNSSSCGMFSR